MLKIKDVFTHQKLIEASKRVKSKNGCSGIDNMTSTEGLEFFKKKYKRDIIIKKLKKGNYIIHKNKIIKITKENKKKKRTLKIQSMIDRIVLDCFNFSIQKEYKSMMSASSYAYVEGRGAHTALEALSNYYNYEDYRYVLKIDLLKYFDKISHSILLKKLDKMFDEPLMNLITLFIQNSNDKGIPQGNPISPFLSNLYLTDFDNWLDSKTEYRYIRYADDILVLSKEPIRVNLLTELEAKLSEIKVKINNDKVEVGKTEDCEFLGLIKTKTTFKVSEKRIEKFKDKVERLSNNINEEIAIKNLNEYIVGWIAYYHIGVINDLIKDVEDKLKSKYEDGIRNYTEILIDIQNRKAL